MAMQLRESCPKRTPGKGPPKKTKTHDPRQVLAYKISLSSFPFAPREWTARQAERTTQRTNTLCFSVCTAALQRSSLIPVLTTVTLTLKVHKTGVLEKIEPNISKLGRYVLGSPSSSPSMEHVQLRTAVKPKLTSHHQQHARSWPAKTSAWRHAARARFCKRPVWTSPSVSRIHAAGPLLDARA